MFTQISAQSLCWQWNSNTGQPHQRGPALPLDQGQYTWDMIKIIIYMCVQPQLKLNVNKYNN